MALTSLYRQRKGLSGVSDTGSTAIDYTDPERLEEVITSLGKKPQVEKANFLERVGKFLNVLNIADPITRVVKGERKNIFDAFTGHFKDTYKGAILGDKKASKQYGTGDLLKAMGIDAGIVNTGLNIIDPLDLSNYLMVGTGKNAISKGGKNLVGQGTKLFSQTNKIDDVANVVTQIAGKGGADEFLSIVGKAEKLNSGVVRDALTRMATSDTGIKAGLSTLDEAGTFLKVPFGGKYKIGGKGAGAVLKPIIDPISTVLSPIKKSGIGKAVRAGTGEVLEKTGKGLSGWFNKYGTLDNLGASELSDLMQTVAKRSNAVGEDAPETVQKLFTQFKNMAPEQQKSFAPFFEMLGGLTPDVGKELDKVDGLSDDLLQMLGRSEGIQNADDLLKWNTKDLSDLLNIDYKRSKSILGSAKKVVDRATKNEDLIKTFEKTVYDFVDEPTQVTKFLPGEIELPKLSTLNKGGKFEANMDIWNETFANIGKLVKDPAQQKEVAQELVNSVPRNDELSGAIIRNAELFYGVKPNGKPATGMLDDLQDMLYQKHGVKLIPDKLGSELIEGGTKNVEEISTRLAFDGNREYITAFNNNGDSLGRVYFDVDGSNLTISDINVNKKRQGIGEELMKALKKEYPDVSVKTNLQTEEGAKFFNSPKIKNILDNKVGYGSVNAGELLKQKEGLLKQVGEAQRLIGGEDNLDARKLRDAFEKYGKYKPGDTPIDRLMKVDKEIDKLRPRGVLERMDTLNNELISKQSVLEKAGKGDVVKDFRNTMDKLKTDPKYSEVLFDYDNLLKAKEKLGAKVYQDPEFTKYLQKRGFGSVESLEIAQKAIDEEVALTEKALRQAIDLEDAKRLSKVAPGTRTKLEWVPQGISQKLNKNVETIMTTKKKLKPEFEKLKPFIESIQKENMSAMNAFKRTGAPLIDSPLGYIHRNTLEYFPKIEDMELPAGTVKQLKDAGYDDIMDVAELSPVELEDVVNKPKDVIEKAQKLKAKYEKGTFKPIYKSTNLKAKTILGDAAKKRTQDTILEGLDKGVKYDMDSAEGLAKALTEQNVYQRRIQILDDTYHKMFDLKDDFGNKMFFDSRADDVGGELVSVAKELGINPKNLPDDAPLKYMYGDPRIVEEMKKVHQKFIDPQYMNKAFTILDKANRVWKQAVTTAAIPIPWLSKADDGAWKVSSKAVPLFPSFTIRNDISGTMANAMFGDVWNPTRYKDSSIISMYRNAVEKGNDEVVKKLGGKLVDGLDGMTVDDVYQSFKSQGGFLSGYTKSLDELLGRAPVQGKSAFNKIMDATSAQGFNEFVENKNRLALFIDQMSKGKNMDDAYQKVMDIHFDYARDAYTDFENQIVARVIPFYKFMKGNLKLHWKTMLTDPARMNKIIDFYNNAPDLLGSTIDDEDRQKLPEWLQNTMYVGSPFNKKGDDNVTVIGGFGTYTEGLNSIFGTTPKRTLQNLLNMVSPIYKTPIEYGTGYNLFKDKPIMEDNNGYFAQNLPEWMKESLGYQEVPYKKKDGTIGTLPKVDPYKKYWFNIFIGRALSQGGRVANFGQDGDPFLDTMDILTGMKTYKFNLEDEEEKRRRERVQTLQNELRRMGVGNTYESFYIGEPARQQFGVEDILRGQS